MRRRSNIDIARRVPVVGFVAVRYRIGSEILSCEPSEKRLLGFLSIRENRARRGRSPSSRPAFLIIISTKNKRIAVVVVIYRYRCRDRAAEFHGVLKFGRAFDDDHTETYRPRPRRPWTCCPAVTYSENCRTYTIPVISPRTYR